MIKTPLSIRLLLITVFLILPSSIALAQFGASLEGTVTDKSGAVIPGATVTITNTSTNVAQTQKTGGEGNYRAVNLQPASEGESRLGIDCLI